MTALGVDLNLSHPYLVEGQADIHSATNDGLRPYLQSSPGALQQFPPRGTVTVPTGYGAHVGGGRRTVTTERVPLASNDSEWLDHPQLPQGGPLESNDAWGLPALIPHVHTIMAVQQQQQQQVIPKGGHEEEPGSHGILKQSNRVNISSGGGPLTPISEGGGKKKPLTSHNAVKQDSGMRRVTGRLSQAGRGTRPEGASVATRHPSAAELSVRSKALSSAVIHLARGIHSATRQLAPGPGHPPPKVQSEHNNQRVLEMEQELEMHGWLPHGEQGQYRQNKQQQQHQVQSSPVVAYGSDSARMSFKPQHQPWELMARRCVDGTGTEMQVTGRACPAGVVRMKGWTRAMHDDDADGNTTPRLVIGYVGSSFSAPRSASCVNWTGANWFGSGTSKAC